VSLISKMVPSPDWFIGIDSFNLCVNGKWLDGITIEVSHLRPHKLLSFSIKFKTDDAFGRKFTKMLRVNDRCRSWSRLISGRTPSPIDLNSKNFG
jgi:hypothetical protein